MNKRDFVLKLSDELGLSYKDARSSLESFLKVIAENLKSWKTIPLSGIWKLTVIESKARKAYNFHTKESIDVPPSKSVRFRGSTLFNKKL